MNNRVHDSIVEQAVDHERERCALLCEQLAAVHQRSADRVRIEGTYIGRAIWPLFKLTERVTPAAERAAKTIEGVVRSLRLMAGCIRLRYDPYDVLKPDDIARIKDYVSPIAALNPPPVPKVDPDGVYEWRSGHWRPKGACYCDLDDDACRAAGHWTAWRPCNDCGDPMDCGSWATCMRSNKRA